MIHMFVFIVIMHAWIHCADSVNWNLKICSLTNSEFGRNEPPKARKFKFRMINNNHPGQNIVKPKVLTEMGKRLITRMRLNKV